MKGVSMGLALAPGSDGLTRLCGPWPFLDALPASPWDFIVMDAPESIDFAQAARLASTGRMVLASCGPGDAAMMAGHVARCLESAGAPAVPVSVLAQEIVRQVCADCAQWTSYPAERAASLGFHPTDLAEFGRHGGLTVRQGQRCARCRTTGTM
jgi:hypothetical protein